MLLREQKAVELNRNILNVDQRGTTLAGAKGRTMIGIGGMIIR